MKNLREEFEARLSGESGDHQDIKEHLETLRRYAMACRVVAEFGTRTGNSTVALALGLSDGCLGELHCYDLDFSKFTVGHLIEAEGVDLTLHKGDTAEAFLPKDLGMLFVDSLHTYEHVKKELGRLKNRPLFIAFHDVELNGASGENGGLGILPAILEFACKSRYEIHHYARNNNGLLVLRKI